MKGIKWELERKKTDLEKKELKEEIKALKDKVFRKKETTTKQQLLILYYTGLLDKIPLEDNTQKGVLLGLLLNRCDENFRQFLSSINLGPKDSEMKTPSNLKFVLTHFQSIGLIEAANKVREDLKILGEIESL